MSPVHRLLTGIRVGTLLVLLSGSSSTWGVAYAPFPDADSIKPEDELEERIWQESDTLRPQFIHASPPEPVVALQSSIRDILVRTWPDVSRHVNLFVVPNADVLALSSANGDLILSTGMLMRLDTEEDVRVVLAREIAHIINRHAVRSVYVARAGAGANVVFQTIVNANSLMGTVGMLASFQVSPEMLIADGGKAFIQAQLGKLKDNMADNFIRSMSASGFEAMVKTSLFGYSESLEREADEAALQQVGSLPFLRVMQRLLDEAQSDEKPFSAFYANADRLQARIEQGMRVDKKLQPAPSTSAPEPKTAGAKPVVASAARASLPPDSIELPPAGPVASVVIVDGGEQSENEAPRAGERPSTDIRATALLAPLAPPQSRHYSELLPDVALDVFQSELELGRTHRAVRDIERRREGVHLPDTSALLLAKGCWSLPEPSQKSRATQLLQNYLEHSPDDAAALKLLGGMELEQGQDALARTHLEKARAKTVDEDERGFIDQQLHRLDKKRASTS